MLPTPLCKPIMAVLNIYKIIKLHFVLYFLNTVNNNILNYFYAINSYISLGYNKLQRYS